ncbi:MAG: hypothetical protein EZS28_015251 [Streblomastix strix]|uniref:Uncharacterized protein n=1 Tax=Streblomastix strix TaxID=222440 RepID=A0A5J4W3W6_9EUKA|nr:MAG: hypothetical protein EZS28_015251 [Streblomastix strix]
MSQSGSQNEAIDYAKVIEVMKIPFVGSETEKKIILDQQENVCQKIIMKYKDKKDDDGRQNAIETGVTDELSTIFESRDLTSISLPFIEAFFCISFPGDKVDFRPIIYKRKNSYPGLLRLLDHKNSDMVLHDITTIVSILNGGIGSTKETEQNPHFQSVEECGGIQKLFTLFQKTSDKVIKDKIAVSFGRLFKAHADEWARSNSILTINYLAQNEDNYTEIMKEFDPLTVIQDLRLPIIGNEEERIQIQHKKNLDCVHLLILLVKAEDNNLLERLIEAGIIEALLYYFETQDLNMISGSPVKIFKQLQSSALTQIEQLKKEKKYYPNILRLLRSSDSEVLSEAYNFVANDFAEGADQAQDAIPNPLFDEISKCGGIEIIFDLFQRNLSQDSREKAASLLVMLFVNQEFSSELMRKEIINYFINPLINSNNDEQEFESWCQEQFAKVVGNHAEILKDDFIAQAIQATSLNKRIKFAISVKIPDEIRATVIEEIKQMAVSENNEIAFLSADVLPMLAENEENHNDIIAEGFPNTISKLLTCGNPKVAYQGLTLALNLLYFGSDLAKQKVKQAVPLNIVRQLTQEGDQNAALTAQLLVDQLLIIS